MKRIRYTQCVEVNRGTDDNPVIEKVFTVLTHDYNEMTEAIAKAEAYNGEYTIEDDGEPEPVIPPTNDELAAENKLLKQQVSALTEQQSFYEDCIAEMASVVYA